MYASIFNAPKTTGFKFELVLHHTPAINGESVIVQMYYPTKPAAKQAAQMAQAKPWNY